MTFFWNLYRLFQRIALNFKKLPYQTEWVELPDIEKVVEEISGSPTEQNSDGTYRYTLPVIRDLSTGAVVSDSEAIAHYLDDTYPAPKYPTLFPSFDTLGFPSTRFVTSTAILSFRQLLSVYGRATMAITFPAGNSILNPVSEAHNRVRKEKLVSSIYGKPTTLEDLSPPGPVRDAAWVEVRKGLEKIYQVLDKNRIYSDKEREKLVFFFGETPSYADICLLASLMHIKSVLQENEEWKMILDWSEGRFGNFLEATKEWQTIL